MRYLLFFLALFARAEAVDSDRLNPPIEKEIVQIPLGYPSNPGAQFRAMQQRIFYLEQQNAELNSQVNTLQSYRKGAELLQLRLQDLEEKFSLANSQNQQLKIQLKQSVEQIKGLTKEQSEYAMELQRCTELLKNAEEQRQLFEQEQKNSRQELQAHHDKSNKLNEDFQKLQASLKSCTQQLQQNPERVVWLNEQIESKNKKIRDLNNQLGELNQQNYALNIAKNVSEQKLQDATKRLEALEKTKLQSVSQAKDKETSLHSTIEEKNASIAKWRHDYDLLKSQLDTVLSLNKELHQQITQLEEECKKRQ